ncbi:hypothetical protein FMUND_4928 [Fusarium mundagurra]|uniref:Uncharacterized protein n=1 Tax=Fusarium mundagurra TaxID=1567541 RepID=A0A8H6DIH0_9HYPO|nr:hypothetical protein FMUND_4928 [Fusarium mundagurra]
MTQKTQGDIGQAGQTDPGLPPADSVQVGHANMAPEIKEEPGSIPLPVIGTRPEDFEADGGHLASRQGDHFMSSPTDLGLYEKLDLADNLRKWVKTEKPELYLDADPDVINISADDRTKFFNALYKDWSSAADIEDMPLKPRARDKDDTRILIGRDDDGESPTKKRKRDEVRRKHKPAYFGVGFSASKGEDKVSFDIKDDSNQIAAAKYVKWNTDNDTNELKRRALTRWERSERARIREFNQKHILICPGMGRSSWSSPIRLVTAFGDRIGDIVSIVQGLEKFDSESQVQRFVDTSEFCPPQCGWLYPLISQLESRNQPVVLLVFQCSKRNCRLDPQDPLSSCFTDIFIAALTTYSALHGILCVAMDFRKECRCSVDDRRCLGLTSAEFNVCGLATIGELYIAYNVYGIRIMATVAISSNACSGMRSLQRVAETSHVMGQVYYIPWHPRLIPSLTMSMSHEVCRPVIKNMIKRSYGPFIWLHLIALSYTSSS